MYRVSDLTMRKILLADGPPRPAGELVRVELAAGPHRLELEGRVGVSASGGMAVELVALDFGRREALATVLASRSPVAGG